MKRTVTDEGSRFRVTDDPHEIIGLVLGMLVSNLSRAELDELLVTGSGYGVDTVGALVHVDHRDLLPEPWDQDPTVDPDSTKLWALRRDDLAISVLLTGDELQDLVGQACRAINHGE